MDNLLEEGVKRSKNNFYKGVNGERVRIICRVSAMYKTPADFEVCALWVKGDSGIEIFVGSYPASVASKLSADQLVCIVAKANLDPFWGITNTGLRTTPVGFYQSPAPEIEFEHPYGH